MVLATGCLDVTLRFTVDSDGSGAFEFDMDVSEEILQMTVAFGEFDSVQSACEDLWSETDMDSYPLGNLSMGDIGVEIVGETKWPMALIAEQPFKLHGQQIWQTPCMAK